MKKLQELHDRLKDIKYELFENNRNSLKDRFEIVGEFVDDELEDAVSVIDSGLDRIHELEDELEDAKNRIDELERELNEAV